MNMFAWKRRGAFIASMLITVLVYHFLILFSNMTYAIIGMLASVFIWTLLGGFMIKNPFTDMLEGKGIICMNIDSTGITQPFIVSVNNPYIKGKFRKSVVEDIFDRETANYLKNPKKSHNQAQIDNNGNITFKLTNKELNDAKFGLYGYPMLIYNAQMQSFITKDFLSSIEKSMFAEHTTLYLNQKVSELTGLLRDFGRYVAEQLKPKSSFLTSGPIIAIVVIVIIIILAILMFPMIKGFISPAADGAITAVQSAAGATQAITPVS